MRIFKYIWVTMLVCMVSCLCAVAQNNNKYLVLDQGIAGEVVNKVIDANAKDADSKDKAWAKMLIDEAFKEYFAQAVPETTIYDQAAIDTLQAQIGRLGKDAKMHKDSTIFFKTKFNEQKKKFEKDKANHKKDLEDARKIYKTEFSKKESVIRDSLALIINELSVLEKYLDSLDNVIAGKDILMASLEKDAQIAQKIIDKLNEKQNLVDKFYMDSFNASLDFINADYVSRVSQAVNDYENYVSLVELPVADEVKEKLYFLKGISAVAVFYHESIAFMDSKFDKENYDALLKDYAELKNNGLKLNTVQNTQYVQIGEALTGLQESVEHFQQEVLRVLKDQGLMPDTETVDNVRSRVNLMIKLFTTGDFMSNDRYYYDVHYKNLNRVVDKTHDTLREMNKIEYQKYLTQLKDSL